MARLSNPGARLATFTVAGDVRRGLEAAGFAVEKKPGFGAKRERLEAASPARRAEAGRQRRRSDAARSTPTPPANPKRVAILGAGIAGAACAEALTRRGVEAIVLDAARALGAGASGNPAGLVMPRLDRGGGPLSELFLAAYLAPSRPTSALAFLRVWCRATRRTREGALADLLNDPPLPTDWFTRHCRTARFIPALAW